MATDEKDMSIAEIMDNADALDRRRRIQVDAQKQVINRLLINRGWSWGEEQALLLAENVDMRAKLEAVGDYVVGMRHSNVARQVLKLIGPEH